MVCVLRLPHSSDMPCSLDYFKLGFPAIITVKHGPGICYMADLHA